MAAPLEIHDLSDVSGDAQEAALAAWLEREKARPFDFTVAPLFRLVVHRLSARRFQLALSFHHAILDGWSVATLLAELFTEYENEGSGAGFRNQALTYRDYVALERAALASPAAAAYWEALLKDSAPQKLPRRRGPREVHCRAGWAWSPWRSTPRWRRS